VRNLIVILTALNCTGLFAQKPLFTQKDTLAFAPDSSYSRDLFKKGNTIWFATSRNGVVQYNERTKRSNMIIPPSRAGEFRAVEVVGKTCYGMVSGSSGDLWNYENYSNTLLTSFTGRFFDDIDVSHNSMIILGDPENSEFTLLQLDLRTGNVSSIPTPYALIYEGCFAASGTTVLHPSDSTIMFVSGSAMGARYHRTDNLGKTWEVRNDLPMKPGKDCGPFSIHFTDKEHGMITGGCYTDPNDADSTSLYTTDGGTTWTVSETCTRGYRSCVTGNKKVQFACGTNGIDISTDGGRNWKAFDSGNYCALLLEKKRLYATTNKGKCIRYRVDIRSAGN